MEKFPAHLQSEYVPLSTREIEKKINEIIEKIDELEGRVEKVEKKKGGKKG